VFLNPSQVFLGLTCKGGEIGRLCGMSGTEENSYEITLRNLKERDNLNI
jgi:hypothetical protein